jgi:hypothetical protein
VEDRDQKLMEAAVDAFLFFVPALAEEIECSLPQGASSEELKKCPPNERLG